MTAFVHTQVQKLTAQRAYSTNSTTNTIDTRPLNHAAISHAVLTHL